MDNGRRLKGLAGATERLAVAAGWALLLLAAYIAFEVLARKFARFSTQGADEVGGYVFAITTTIGFSYALYRNTHVRVNLLLPHLPRPVRAGLDLLALMLLSVYAWLLAWRAIAVALSSLDMKAIAPTALGTPLVIPQGLWAVSLTLFGVIVLARLWALVLGLFRGEIDQTATTFEPPPEARKSKR